ncbi:MAG: YiiX/YebB-like N1pC/P60 family cysteine hydrolase [Gammaproteobacteria bacterium]|nr:YiiX/YebB-like N1pC/P60 family cysteine hydrolase [Gammaproteobacteria bacterium]MDH5803336.1 YiiX/YebB-like N1pC/P60 family cysteine hydrolase [Gammaproteobacteria bacterium]
MSFVENKTEAMAIVNPKKWLIQKIVHWLTHEEDVQGTPPCDMERLSFEIRPCDVVLVEGRARVSDVIKTITQSSWTHSALYIGRMADIEDPNVREHINWVYDGDPDDQLIIEPLLGEGTVVAPLHKYAKDHLRICRPQGLLPQDVPKVIAYATKHIGYEYNVRQLVDLARFLLPYGIVPRRWRSSLFEHNAGESTKAVCSTLIAAAFATVQFPILPVIHKEGNTMRMYKRNTRLYTPRDFDYSPYFQIIKYPLLGLNDLSVYRQLPWDQNGVVCNDENECFLPMPQSSSQSGQTAPADKIGEYSQTYSNDVTESGTTVTQKQVN